MRHLINIIIFFTALNLHATKNYEISSLDGKIHVSVYINNGIKINVMQNGRSLFSASNIEMHLMDGRILGNRKCKKI